MDKTNGAVKQSPFYYCGRIFSLEEIETIRKITDDPWNTTRAAIARAVCEDLHWVKPDGRPKLTTCSVALDRMEEHGVIWLPLPTTEHSVPRRPTFTAVSEPQAPITGSRSDLKDVHLVQVTRTDSGLWNELIGRYHYLGHQHMAGAQMRYLAYDEGRLLAAFGFCAASLKLAPRDRFIGWTNAERESNIHLVIQNRRFLMLPWVNVRGLASSLLAMVARHLPMDFEKRYAYRPALVETFTEQGHFSGASYAAANWIFVGESQGRGRLAPSKQATKSVKDIWLYPLDQNFRAILTNGRFHRTQR